MNTASNKTITMSRSEFDEIKAGLIHLDAELNRLLAQPPVFATVVKADDKLLRNDDGMNVVVVFDGKLYEVQGLPGVIYKPSDNVRVDVEAKRILA